MMKFPRLLFGLRNHRSRVAIAMGVITMGSIFMIGKNRKSKAVNSNDMLIGETITPLITTSIMISAFIAIFD